MLEIKKARKVYPGGTVAVRDVDLTLPRGEIVGLFGENGAGFMRLNVATPRAVLQKALESLKLAVEKL